MDKKILTTECLKFLEQNPNKTKIWIRDLYHQIFPTKEDYIKFIRGHYSLIKNIGLMKEPITIAVDIYKHTRTINYIFKDNDFWKSISSKNKRILEQFLKYWFINKSKKKRKLWNYYILGISEGKIANLLEDDFYSVNQTIFELKKDFLKSLLTVITIKS